MNTPPRTRAHALRSVLFLLLLLAPCAGATGAEVERFEVGRIDGRPLTLELVVPEGPGPHPVIAWIHGGGWQGGGGRRGGRVGRAAAEIADHSEHNGVGSAHKGIHEQRSAQAIQAGVWEAVR